MDRAEQITEFIKCKNDFVYFCLNYVLIEVPGGDIHLPLYEKQIEMIDKLQKYKNLIVLKSRQTGVSTTSQAYCAWLAVFHDNVVIGIISKDSKEATAFARAVRTIIDKLPNWMKPPKGKSGYGFDKFTEQSFILTNGSKVISATVNPIEPQNTLKGQALTFLIIDEAAFVGKLNDAWTNLVPTVSTAQMHARNKGIPYGIIVISTPNKTTGTGSWYYQKWLKAQIFNPDDYVEGRFAPMILHWKDIKELANDPLWYKTQCERFDNDERRIKQELELQFLPTTGSFFDEKTCSILQDETKNIKYEVQKLFNGECHEFEKPIPGKYYIIGIDTASEYGQDMSAITIWDYETINQVWEYQGKLPVTDFCKVAEYACALYPGVVVPENNSLGNQIAEYLDRSPYGTMLYKHRKSENTLVRGITTDLKTRPLMINALYSYVTQYPNMIKSQRLALELIGLISKPNGKVEADTGSNDDLAMTLAFCAYVRKHDPPLALSATHSAISEEFKNIIEMNQSSYTISDEYIREDEEDFNENRPRRSFDAKMRDMNARMLKRAKNEIDSNNVTNNYVDTIQFYRG